MNFKSNFFLSTNSKTNLSINTNSKINLSMNTNSKTNLSINTNSNEKLNANFFEIVNLNFENIYTKTIDVEKINENYENDTKYSNSNLFVLKSRLFTKMIHLIRKKKQYLSKNEI